MRWRGWSERLDDSRNWLETLTLRGWRSSRKVEKALFIILDFNVLTRCGTKHERGTWIIDRPHLLLEARCANSWSEQYISTHNPLQYFYKETRDYTLGKSLTNPSAIRPSPIRFSHQLSPCVRKEMSCSLTAAAPRFSSSSVQHKNLSRNKR